MAALLRQVFKTLEAQPPEIHDAREIKRYKRGDASRSRR